MKLLSAFKTPVIEFLCEESYFDVAPVPHPAGQNIPKWFRGIPARSETTRDVHGKPMMTAKKCLPMIDAMSFGYIIPMPIDQHVMVNADCSSITLSPTSVNFSKGAEFHSTEQLGGRSELFPGPPLKFVNPWVIKTPPGWSTLFIPPINHFDDRFICLGGLVDTDKYPKHVNFPARWLKPSYDGTIEAGTPLVTAIPFKRTSMKHIVGLLKGDDLRTVRKLAARQQSRDHVYTRELREKK